MLGIHRINPYLLPYGCTLVTIPKILKNKKKEGGELRDIHIDDVESIHGRNNHIVLSLNSLKRQTGLQVNFSCPPREQLKILLLSHQKFRL